MKYLLIIAAVLVGCSGNPTGPQPTRVFTGQMKTEWIGYSIPNQKLYEVTDSIPPLVCGSGTLSITQNNSTKSMSVNDSTVFQFENDNKFIYAVLATNQDNNPTYRLEFTGCQ